MKKLLLSMALLAGFTAAAETVSEDFKTANTWFGIDNKNNVTADVKTATSPTTSIEYSYTFSYASKDNGVIMMGSSNTPADSENAYLSFSLSMPCAEITFTTGAKASTAAVVNVYAGATVISENLALNAQGTDFKVAVPADYQAAGTVYKVENVSKKNAQFQTIAYSSEGGTVEPIDPPVPPVEPTTVKFEKATSFESGKYIFVVNGKIAQPIRESYTYGQMFLDVEATYEGDYIAYEEENAMTVNVENGKATMMDKYNRYYGMDDSHFTSFQMYTEVNDGCYWTATFEGDNIRLTNTKNTDCFIAQNWNTKADAFYNNIAPGKNTDPAQFILPIAYKKVGGSAVEAIEAEVDADAPVVYYNLQGQRVANPDNGLYIRVCGNKVEKVAIR